MKFALTLEVEKDFSMEETMRRILAAGLILAYANEAGAGAVGKHSVEDKTFGANQIVHGKITSAQSETYRNQFGDELIITRAQIKVKEIMKGDPADVVEIVVEKRRGGADLSEGEEVIAFLEETPDGLMPHSGGHGILKVVSTTKRVRNSKLTVDSVREKVKKVNLWQQAF
jgi:hypothetical protein